MLALLQPFTSILVSGPFILLTSTEDLPKTFYGGEIEIYRYMIWNWKFLKIFEYVHVNMNKMFLWKIYIFKIFFKRLHREALFYVFGNLFKVWLNRRQVETHNDFCIQSVVTGCFGWHTGSRMQLINIHVGKIRLSQCSWMGFQEPPKSLYHT